MSSWTEPLDVDGIAGLTKRNNDWTANDQIWVYLPATRRVRRVNVAGRSDPIAGIDVFGEDVDCFAGKIESYDWKLIGDGAVLAPVIPSVQLIQTKTGPPNRFEVLVPTLRAAYETSAAGAPWLIVEGLAFTPRPVWIVEGTPKDPYYTFGKVIMYIDQDLYRIYWKLVYKRDGQYFYNAMCASQTARTADGTFSAVIHNLIAGVNDATNHAGLVRMQSAFVDRNDPKGEFTLSRPGPPIE